MGARPRDRGEVQGTLGDVRLHRRHPAAITISSSSLLLLLLLLFIVLLFDFYLFLFFKTYYVLSLLCFISRITISSQTNPPSARPRRLPPAPGGRLVAPLASAFFACLHVSGAWLVLPVEVRCYI